MGGWRLKIRHGSRVDKRDFPSLDAALEATRVEAERIRADGNLETIRVFREHPPGQRVHGRLEISAPGVIRRREGGVDVMGDGALVPYTGSLRKEVLHPKRGDSPFDALRDALAGAGG